MWNTHPHDKYPCDHRGISLYPFYTSRQNRGGLQRDWRAEGRGPAR